MHTIQLNKRTLELMFKNSMRLTPAEMCFMTKKEITEWNAIIK